MAIQPLAAGRYVDIHIDCANQSPLRLFRHRPEAARCGCLRQGQGQISQGPEIGDCFPLSGTDGRCGQGRSVGTEYVDRFEGPEGPSPPHEMNTKAYGRGPNRRRFREQSGGCGASPPLGLFLGHHHARGFRRCRLPHRCAPRVAKVVWGVRAAPPDGAVSSRNLHLPDG